MLTIARKRLQKDDEDGFTLIELMVVVLIIAILLAIAIPTFLGAQDRARDRAAQSDLRNGITAAKTIATDSAGLMTAVDASSLGTAEGALQFGSTGSTTTVGVVKSTGDTPAGSNAVLLYKESASGKFFGIVATKSGTVSYCSGTGASSVNVISSCSATKW